METSGDNGQAKNVFKQFYPVAKSFFSFLSPEKNKTSLAASSVLSPQPRTKAFKMTASMDKIPCANYVDF